MQPDNEPKIPPPNYTQIPNVFFDEIMPQLKSLAETKVMLAVMRQTFGFHKKSDLLSLSQIETLTGLSHQSASDGVKGCLAKGILKRKEKGQSFLYAVNIHAPINTQNTPERVVKNLDYLTPEPVKNLDQSSSQEFRLQVVKNLDQSSQEFRHTKETFKEKKESTTPNGVVVMSEKNSSENILFFSEEQIFQAYPRKVKKPLALKAIKSAVSRLVRGEDKPAWWGGEVWPPPDPAGWLEERATKFAQVVGSGPREDGEDDYRPHPATWFNAAGYSDDEKEWKQYARKNQNGINQPNHQSYASAAQRRGAELQQQLDNLAAGRADIERRKQLLGLAR